MPNFMNKKKAVLINQIDNVLVSCVHLPINEVIENQGQTITCKDNIGAGHKVANSYIKKGQKIIRYGVSIGSATVDIKIGEHVHLHNMKSDYIPSHTRQSIVGA